MIKIFPDWPATPNHAGFPFRTLSSQFAVTVCLFVLLLPFILYKIMPYQWFYFAN